MCDLVKTTRILSCNYNINCALYSRFSFFFYQPTGKTTFMFAIRQVTFLKYGPKFLKRGNRSPDFSVKSFAMFTFRNMYLFLINDINVCVFAHKISIR